MSIFDGIKFIGESAGQSIAEYIKSLPGFNSRNAASDSEVKLAENELGLKFNKDYRECLLELGAFSVKSIEFMGICKSKYLDIVHNTKQEWELNEKVPHNMYLIENTCIDGIMIWQNTFGEVFMSRPFTTPKKIASSLKEYIDDTYYE